MIWEPQGKEWGKESPKFKDRGTTKNGQRPPGLSREVLETTDQKNAQDERKKKGERDRAGS